MRRPRVGEGEPGDGHVAMAVRAATAGDLARVAAIEVASFTDPWSAAAFARLLDDPRVFFTVAVGPDGRVEGYVVAWFVLDEGEIANLAVAAQLRGHGVGGMLLDAALDAARARGVASVYLEVRESNAAAQALYAGRGFVTAARRRRYYRHPLEDALVLRRDLAPP